MPCKRTTNYQLCQWEASDRVHHDDFNEDNRKLDEAIKAVDVRVDGKADAGTVAAIQNTLSALQSAVSGKQDASGALKLAVGCYVGNVASVSNGTASGSQTIRVGFEPKAVLVIPEAGNIYNSEGSGHVYGGLAVTDCPGYFNGHNTVEISGSGFIVYTFRNTSAYFSVQVNDQNRKYHYVALG